MTRFAQLLTATMVAAFAPLAVAGQTTTPPASAETAPAEPAATEQQSAAPIVLIDPVTLADSAHRLAAEQASGGTLPVIKGGSVTPQAASNPTQGGKVIRLPGATDAAAAPGDPQALSIVKPAAPGAPSSGTGAVSSAVQALSFTPSAAIRTEMRAGVEESFPEAEVTPDMTAFNTALASQGYDNGTRAYLQVYGMSPDNVADTTAVYLATAWQVVHGQPIDPSKTQMRALRDQLALTYQANGTAQADDAQKQRIAEASLATAALISQGAAGVAADPELAETAKSETARLVKDSFGLDLTTLQLTDAGLR